MYDFKTTDGGAHLAKLGAGIEGLSLTSLILDPTNSMRLYAGAAGAGLFRYGAAATRAFEIRRRLQRGD
jgi:hypothetical protein